ncbi:acetyltransferase, CysE/LacA/LpxA/NodL family protein [Limnobacter sp. MED105]|uniref:acetyltransferase, CysE/LacA/LpxA/NodL family protein n=1 Tax=Limnobacter sp. MED105 TaxID=391597 RepID=UPI000156C5F8|nr:acetyltransferase, CysE/LacA/LpxA/NodL family protein [Limnobacter sp. MED105]EDM85042.1 acetyltransferase, CysE/LacA/LpxA/NodL family protein [Limnobacter sp. MED105]
MGDYCAIAANVDCYNVAPITLQTKVAISQRSFLCTASHDISSVLRPLIYSAIRVESHVWVAAEAMIHPGVTLHEGCVVGARAVVLRDVQPWSIVVGSPATVVGIRKVTDKDLLQVPKGEV